MTAYYIAGIADDPALAWVETIAHMIAVNFPHVRFHMEMKPKEEWKAFVTDVFRKYDFSGFDDNFQGPLIWTPEGQLIGRGADFVQQIYTEKFKLTSPPMVTDEKFRKIAKDNMAEVQAQKQRLKTGPGFAERLEQCYGEARQAAVLLPPEEPEERCTVTTAGVTVELWFSKSLAEQRAARLAKSEEDAKSEEEVKGEEVTLKCCAAEIGQEKSHYCLLHPRPLGKKHVALVPRRLSKQGEETLEVLHRATDGGQQKEEGLGKDDFMAAATVLLSGAPGAAVGFWTGLTGRSGSHLDPVDTHLQVLPDGLQPDEPAFPTALLAERLLKAKAAEFGPLRGFRHALLPVLGETQGQVSATELGAALQGAFEEASVELRKQAGAGAGVMLAFTPKWLLLLPLRCPSPDKGFEEAVWRKMPPPPPCALLGVVISPIMEKSWPEVAQPDRSEASLVSNRAQLEGIPESAEEFAAAVTDVRVCVAAAKAAPLEMLKYWAFPAP
mmetsp:Transcript_65845/g.132263  ORF Transcript_65845/g.132263 Transcript_65845/m.132263 type:complete len:497 (+) Transcript_65845:95-1585(+)